MPEYHYYAHFLMTLCLIPLSLATDGKIKNIEVFGYQKRYNPEKYYVSNESTSF